MQQRAFQMDADAANARFEKQERIYSGLEGMRKGNKPGRFLGSESSILRPVRWKRHTTLLKVSEYPLLSSEVEPILNIISGGRIIPKQVDGRGEQRLQREFEDRLSGLWQRHNPAEGENAAEQAWSSAEGRQESVSRP